MWFRVSTSFAFFGTWIEKNIHVCRFFWRIWESSSILKILAKQVHLLWKYAFILKKVHQFWEKSFIDFEKNHPFWEDVHQYFFMNLIKSSRFWKKFTKFEKMFANFNKIHSFRKKWNKKREKRKMKNERKKKGKRKKQRRWLSRGSRLYCASLLPLFFLFSFLIRFYLFQFQYCLSIEYHVFQILSWCSIFSRLPCVKINYIYLQLRF